ncbi:SOS response-associated peptidase [Fodinibius sp. Rm-B-1B1-1]|uniref:SOS response-associated peptidase n=1 Tax=Fodinibius alkaliphilus TaxID=3140241 RepID=UPI00315B25BC
MSDRFVLEASKQEVEQQFSVSTARDDFFESDYNITPGSLVPVVYGEDGGREIYNFRWGLIPPNADEEMEGNENFAVPVEELNDNEWLTECVEQRRCLIPANGYYKWKFSEKKSTPFYIRLLSNNLTAIGGIYSVWKSSAGRDVYSCALLTTEANMLVQPVDDRMPILIHPDYYEQWLSDDALGEDQIADVINGYAMTEFAVNRVSEDVNDPENNGAELIQPIPK